MSAKLPQQEIARPEREGWLDRVAPGASLPATDRAPVLGILTGEGIGAEVIAAALDVLGAVEATQSMPPLERRPGAHVAIGTKANRDGTLTTEAAAYFDDIFRQGGAMLCGPGGGRFVYDLRNHFNLFCKLTPLRPVAALRRASPLKERVLRDVDILMVRDNAGGVYQGRWGVRQDPQDGCIAEHQFSYTEAQVERILEVSARLARARRGRMDVAIKDAGVPTISDLWRRVGRKVADEAGVTCAFHNVDYVAYALIRDPQQFDVLVAPNLLGDILADLGAVFQGSRGLSFSGNFSARGQAVYQTGHGAAHDLAGTDRANPVGQILSLAMMLRLSYARPDAADLIERAVENIYQAGYRTDDLAEADCQRVGTRRMGELVAGAVTSLARAAVPA